MQPLVRPLVFAAVFVLASAAPSFAATVLFSDDFEAGIGNWTATTGAINTAVGNPGTAMYLDAFDNGGGTIDTVAVTTSAFATFGLLPLHISFDYFADRTEANDTLRLFASFDGGAVTAITAPLELGPPGTTSGDAGLNWTTLAFDLAGPSSSNMKLEFVLIATAGTESARVDNVLVTADAVNQDVGATPLPAALPMFVAGLGLIGGLGYRKRRKAQKRAA